MLTFISKTSKNRDIRLLHKALVVNTQTF